MNDTSDNKPTAGAEASPKPARCPRFPGCIFFNDKMAEMPDTAESIKDQFCRGNFPSCARYILQSVWNIKAPDDMYPYQTARGQAILEATVVDPKNKAVTSVELEATKRTMNMIVSTIGHGFMMFDKEGKCLPFYSKACGSLLEVEPEGKHLSEVLHLDEKQTETMGLALKLVFNQTHAMSFDEVMKFAPKLYKHSTGALVQLTYMADRLPTGALDHVVVIAKDITEQVHERESSEERKALFESLERILCDRIFFGSYFRQLMNLLSNLEKRTPGLSWDVLRREIHTFKGETGIFRLNKIVGYLHDIETTITSELMQTQLSDVSLEDKQFKKVMEIHQELVKELLDLSDYLKDFLGFDITKIEGERSFDKSVLYDFAKRLKGSGQQELYAEYMQKVCAESIQGYLKRYDLVLKELSLRLNKNVGPVKFEGQDVPLVMDNYRGLLDSFIHLFRNALDHGIEAGEDRVELGKPEKATITVSTELNNDKLHIEIKDDGAGMPLAKLRQSLAKKDPSKAWGTCNDEEVVEALLAHDVSSRDEVSLYSGRGVGVGAVYAKVKELGGEMKIETENNKGTTIFIDVPYRLQLPEA